MYVFILQLSRQENREGHTTQAAMPSNKYSSAIMAESDKMTATVRVCGPRLQYKLLYILNKVDLGLCKLVPRVSLAIAEYSPGP